MKIGLLGGTFNPIHTGHLILAQECWYQLALDKVIFIPAYIPPHKELEGNISVADRLNMARLALKHDKRFEICTYEIDNSRVSYSIDTVRHLRQKFDRRTELFFLAGADSAESLSMWKDVGELLKLVTFVIASRPGWGLSSAFEGKVKRILIPAADISSSIIRERVGKREPIDYLVPDKTVKYIRNKGLYRP
ncbi:MAG: nicotinate-nucleotide adenylyltransferase [Candidatus Omnitrophota bacterium]